MSVQKQRNRRNKKKVLRNTETEALRRRNPRKADERRRITFDSVEDLLDSQFTPITVYVHLQDMCLQESDEVFSSQILPSVSEERKCEKENEKRQTKTKFTLNLRTSNSSLPIFLLLFFLLPLWRSKKEKPHSRRS